jgi:hypothetical protein
MGHKESNALPQVIAGKGHYRLPSWMKGANGLRNARMRSGSLTKGMMIKRSSPKMISKLTQGMFALHLLHTQKDEDVTADRRYHSSILSANDSESSISMFGETNLCEAQNV